LPFSISSFNTPMDFPVLREISDSGLNPALIICSRSCPISRPDAVICEKASVNEFNLFRSPIAISPSALMLGMIRSCAMPNESIIFAASCNSAVM